MRLFAVLLALLAALAAPLPADAAQGEPPPASVNPPSGARASSGFSAPTIPRDSSPLGGGRTVLLVAGIGAAGWLALRTFGRRNTRLGGRNCPFCRHYGPKEDRQCGHCGKRLPPAILDPLLRHVLGVDLWATKLLAGVSMVVFSLQLAMTGLDGIGLVTGMPVSVMLRFGAVASGLEAAEPWRLLAACFVHMGVLHIGMNLLAFAELGREAERQIGGSRLVLAYVVTGVVGFLVGWAWYSYTQQPYISAGASGAVFGIDGVLVGMLARRKDRRWKEMLIRTIVHSFVFYFVVRTNQAAHLGGLATGFAMGLFFGRESRPWRVAAVVRVATIVSALAVVASIGLSARSSVWHEAAEQERAERDASDDGE